MTEDHNQHVEKERVALVTGTLAEPSVRAVADELATQFDIVAEVVVLNIQVAALMTTQWVARKLRLPKSDSSERPDRVILPGYCRGDIDVVSQELGLPVEKGPHDLQDLPFMFDPTADLARRFRADGNYDIEIIAEINHAAHLPLVDIIDDAQSLVAQGADVIDLGCDPQTDRPSWREIEQTVRELRDRSIRVSVDSFHPVEIAAACRGGAELVLSVNSNNCDVASEWATEVVVVPDDPHVLKGLDGTVERLDKAGVPFRIDPVIEPIGFGFAQSMGRYLTARRHYPDAAMMMGIGNLTEMTEVDSAGVNMLLLGFCQELAIHSVLTTEVINWARSSVREIDLARRMVHHAVNKHTVPKHLDDRLVMLRDARLRDVNEMGLARLAKKLTDANVRLFADPTHGHLHAINQHVHAKGDDPFMVFDELEIDDPSHAFYLGYEMSKAVTAITLGKNYTQDQALDWGLLRKDEVSHFERRKGSRGQ